MKIAFAIDIVEQDGVYRATFLDFPGASVSAPERSWLLYLAQRRLTRALRCCIKQRLDIPRPSPAGRRGRLVQPPPLIAAKVALYLAMREGNITNVALARRLGTVEGTVRRLIDPDHRSHIDKVTEALSVLGRDVTLSVGSNRSRLAEAQKGVADRPPRPTRQPSSLHRQNATPHDRRSRRKAPPYLAERNLARAMRAVRRANRRYSR